MKVKSPLLIIAGTLCSSIALAAVPAAPQSQPPVAPQQVAHSHEGYVVSTQTDPRMAQQLAQLEQEVGQLQQQQAPLPVASQSSEQISAPQGRLPFSAGSIFGNLVVTGPSVGITTHYDGSELIVNSSSIYTDYKLLQRKQKEMHELEKRGYAKPSHPHLVLSGNIEGEASYLDPYTGSDSSDINLSTAELDSYIEMSPWVNGIMIFTYDDGISTEDPSRVNHSEVKLDRGFITIGNLNRAPVFGSIGQMYVPFGRYSNSTISNPLTKDLGRTKERTIDLGFRLNNANTPYATGYVFRPHIDDTTARRINGYGADIGYAFNIQQKVSGDVGVGYISTLADSGAMQSGGFGGIASGSYALRHNVPGLDIHGNIGYGPVTLIAEYVASVKSFDSADLRYNNDGAKPTAVDVEGDYGFNGPWGKPMTFALAYSHSTDALALSLPKDRYMVALTTAIMRDTLFKLEYRYDTDYSSGNTASIASGAPVTGTGKSSNSAIAALDIYF